MTESTIKFTVPCDDKENMHATLRSVFDALNEKGYNPINQLVGYLSTDEPTYITSHNNARTVITQFERNELLEYILKKYFEKEEN